MTSQVQEKESKLPLLLNSNTSTDKISIFFVFPKTTHIKVIRWIEIMMINIKFVRKKRKCLYIILGRITIRKARCMTGLLMRIGIIIKEINLTRIVRTSVTANFRATVTEQSRYKKTRWTWTYHFKILSSRARIICKRTYS